MSLRHVDNGYGLSRPRARAPTALVSGAALLLALASTAVAGSPDSDTDCDGVVDASDDCRAVAEDRDGHDDLDGCPDADTQVDKDRVEVEQLALFRPWRVGAVRQWARARASARSAVDRYRTQVEPGCLPVSPAESERSRRTAWSSGAARPGALDGGGADQRLLDDDRMQAANARARPELEDWTATRMGGFAF